MFIRWRGAAAWMWAAAPAVVLAAAACGGAPVVPAERYVPPPLGPQPSAAAAPSVVAPPAAAAPAPAAPAPRQSPPAAMDADLPIGVGDLIQISVVDLPELASVSVRVPLGGAIALPLLGSVPAAGSTAQELAEDIRRRLQADFMHDPRVAVLVTEQQSPTARDLRRPAEAPPSPQQVAPAGSGTATGGS